MASTATRNPKRRTRADRDRAREAAASKNATMDLRPAAMTNLVIVGVPALAFVAGMLVPGGVRFGGPLQSDRLESGSTMSAFDKTRGKGRDHRPRGGAVSEDLRGPGRGQAEQRSTLGSLSAFVSAPTR